MASDASAARPLAVERLVDDLASGAVDVPTFMERLDALVAAPKDDTEAELRRIRNRWRAIL